ncbi:Dolichol-phosphate mannosyltransferase subunit 3, partial [Ostertagia ostertagi]
APIYAVLLLGIYALGSVVYGVATFNDCPTAKEELVQVRDLWSFRGRCYDWKFSRDINKYGRDIEPKFDQNAE